MNGRSKLKLIIYFSNFFVVQITNAMKLFSKDVRLSRAGKLLVTWKKLQFYCLITALKAD